MSKPHELIRHPNGLIKKVVRNDNVTLYPKYGDDNLLTHIIIGEPTTNARPYEFSVKYDKDGRILSTHVTSGKEQKIELLCEYKYDRRGHLKSMNIGRLMVDYVNDERGRVIECNIYKPAYGDQKPLLFHEPEWVIFKYDGDDFVGYEDYLGNWWDKSVTSFMPDYPMMKHRFTKYPTLEKLI